MPAWTSHVSTWRSSLRPTPTSGWPAGHRPMAQLGPTGFCPRESARLRPKLAVWQANQWTRYHRARKLAKTLRPSPTHPGPIRHSKFSRSGSRKNAERAPMGLGAHRIQTQPKNFTCVACLKTYAGTGESLQMQQSPP
jgi:hypothetical protein